ncbi:MAG: tRNA lysidine(34) synthetase TilS [Thermodesulfobacteriota bacterium]
MAATIPNHHKQHDFLGRVSQTIAHHRMFSSGESVLIGVSGGADSSALLQVMIQLAPVLYLKPAVAHLNHGLRPLAADEEEAFVASRAAQLGLPFFSKKVDVRALHSGSGLSLEEIGRKIRYGFFTELMKTAGFTKLVLGHHRDDNAELILMNLIRGSGTLGLTGIPPARDGYVVRPLIELSKQEIYAYVHEQRIPFREDLSNEDRRFLRNRIRHELLPLLRSSYNPNITETLNRLGRILADEEHWAAGYIQTVLTDLTAGMPDGCLRVSASRMALWHVAVRRRLLRELLRKQSGGLRRITFEHIEALLRLAEKGAPDGMLNLPGGIVAERSGDQLEFRRSTEKRPGRKRPGAADGGFTCYRALFPDGFEPLTIRIEELGRQIRFSTVGPEELNRFGTPGKQIGLFDIDRLQFPMILRTIRPGDFFQPLGLKGRQKVSKFFIDHKIPRNDRNNCLILESGGRIIWIAGHRIDDSVKLTENTRQVVKAEWLVAD